MAKSGLVLLALVLVGAWMIGCGDDGPSDPGNGGGTGNRAPGTPTIDTGAGAPDDGSTGESISSILHWECTDPDGDDLTFEVFFGTAADPPSVNTGQTVENYNPGALDYSTKYYWKIVAEDPDGLTATSAVWDFTTMAQGAETVTTPTAPTGPGTGATGESLSFTTGGATNSAGHAVQYRFDWGGGNYSNWGASATVAYSWAAAGTYNVKAQARCAAHTTVMSAWSTGHDVVISAGTETVSTPPTPTGPVTADTSENPRFDFGGATSSEGHTVEYRVDWGTGEISSWSTGTYRHNVFDTPGTYEVKAQARCRDHTGVESAWSGAASIDITEAAEVVYTPPVAYGPSTAYIGDSKTYEMSHGISTSLGHDVEYRFDWKDGTFSAWSSSLSASHAWTTAGTYRLTVTARCAVHTSIESREGSSFTVDVTDAAETVSAPSHMSSATSSTDINTSIWVSTSGAISSHGHDVEYRLDFDDGSMTAWGLGAGASTYHSWAAYGVYEVKGQARCIADTLVVSGWSAPRNITVAERVSVPSTPAGPASGTVGATLTYTASGSISSGGHPLEYRLRCYKSGVSVWTDWSATGIIDHVFDSAGQWDVRAQARCIEHQVRSNTGNRLYVTITDP